MTVIVALEVPLAINLQRRARTDFESQAKISTLQIAQAIGAERVAKAVNSQRPLARTALQRWISAPGRFSQTEDGRVIVVDAKGVLIADSLGSQNLGRAYATPGRFELQQVLATQAPFATTRHSISLGQDILVAAAPIVDERLFYGAIRITESMAGIQEQVRRSILGLAVIGFASLLAGLIIAFGLAESFSGPLRRLARAARRLGGGDLGARAETSKGAREIAQLAQTFDDMADRLAQTVRAQREFVANASHQLRTPLTGMKLRLESAIEQAPTDDLRRDLEAADREVDRLAGIVERLLVMARRVEEGGPAEVDVGEAVQRAAERWGERARQLGSTLTVLGSGGQALGQTEDLDQILDNLLDNAISYAPGSITLETVREDERVVVAVEDRGPGIAAEDRPRVTERFFRGRGAPQGGSGLGLAIVRELAEKWGGTVSVQVPAEGGTRVEIRLRATS